MRKTLSFILLLVIFFIDNQNIFAQKKAVFLNEKSSWVDSVMSTMSEDERIAQLFMVAAYSNRGEIHQKNIIDLIENYKIGGLMFLQGSPVRQAQLTNLYQKKSKTPLMIAILN